MTNEGLFERVQEAVAFLEQQGAPEPALGMIIGAGLERPFEVIDAGLDVPCREIPHFPHPPAGDTEYGLLFGTLGGKPVVSTSGHFSVGRGYSVVEAAFPVRVMGCMGARTLLITDSVSGLASDLGPGSLVLVEDHINFLGDNPLLGPNDERLGPRFPDMSSPYSVRIKELARELAISESIPLQSGVYAAVAGADLKTEAECRFLNELGADMVGDGTVPEVIAAVHQGMEVLALCAVSDHRFHDKGEPLTAEEYLAAVARALPSMTRLVTRVVEEL